ncbi:MAG: tail fiber protein [Gammaproteobacteria bacterium]|nr:tail fiber protein [Gammaproteobacteria bacterium]
MDTRNYKSGAGVSPPVKLATPSVGFPHGGDPATGTPATVPGAFYHYAIAEEMRNVILGAGLTPNDDELDQFWQAILLTVAPPPPAPIASIIAVPTSTVPDNYLLADGSAINRTTYADLFVEIGTLYGSGDGSTTFNIPDYRGEFLRGLDSGRGVDTGRALGVDQDSQANSIESFSTGQQAGASTSGTATVPDDGSASAARHFQFGSGGSRTWLTMQKYGYETRPRNQAVVYMIKY